VWQLRPKEAQYVRITTYQPDTKSNPNPNRTTKQHAIVNIQLNIVICPTYPDKFIRDNVVAPSVPTLGCNCDTAFTFLLSCSAFFMWTGDRWLSPSTIHRSFHQTTWYNAGHFFFVDSNCVVSCQAAVDWSGVKCSEYPCIYCGWMSAWSFCVAVVTISDGQKPVGIVSLRSFTLSPLTNLLLATYLRLWCWSGGRGGVSEYCVL